MSIGSQLIITHYINNKINALSVTIINGKQRGPPVHLTIIYKQSILKPIVEDYVVEGDVGTDMGEVVVVGLAEALPLT